MAKKPKTVRGIRANVGTIANYSAALDGHVKEMHDSMMYWLQAAYKKQPPALATLVANDATPPSKRIKKILKQYGDKWIQKFNEWAPILAERYTKETFKHTDGAFRRALRESGWAVEFTMSPAVADAFQASLAENIGLIRSIPEKYLQQVEGAVMRAYAVGGDLQAMVKDLNAIYPGASHRAKLIARDQTRKATAVVQRARQLELGFVDAIWMHSHAGKEPRISHMKAGKDKRQYKIAEGCYIDGEYIQPGEKINCRCTARAVLPF
jgi:uncharacterized protein with gpF-like domain